MRCTLIGIMPVIEDHPPFGLGISARYAGDRGSERPVLEPHDHLHNKQNRTSRATADAHAHPAGIVPSLRRGAPGVPIANEDPLVLPDELGTSRRGSRPDHSEVRLEHGCPPSAGELLVAFTAGSCPAPGSGSGRRPWTDTTPALSPIGPVRLSAVAFQFCDELPHAAGIGLRTGTGRHRIAARSMA
jgi:hypothetical protein